MKARSKMATFKFIEPNTETIKKLQIAFEEADCTTQGAEEKIKAATHAIKLMLKESDSGQQRLCIKTLCKLIEYHAFDVMNTVNSLAEEAGANHVNETSRAAEKLIYAAARGEAANV